MKGASLQDIKKQDDTKIPKTLVKVSDDISSKLIQYIHTVPVLAHRVTIVAYLICQEKKVVHFIILHRHGVSMGCNKQ